MSEAEPYLELLSRMNVNMTDKFGQIAQFIRINKFSSSSYVYDCLTQ